ncbi:plasma membrane ascorbate-dependent reductase CYBRD1-like isoform X6 [Aricia agestis]|uniref:plasma membrane ascorbate-dependent reductase CYBRD1-like isoform X6 n=1 Tax=Aricia agestis TaxID=91739 RepID=UPI001C201BBE|nr:plasma membrane ascorbate-dependent reductase CYBRD1-like isoform X6 [Aricia agestis]
MRQRYQLKQTQRSRSYESDEHERGACEWCEYALVITLATILLIGVSALTVFWMFFYREGYGWADDIPEKQFNLHPTLMVAGFITFSGFSVLLYRICRCFRRIYVKLLHAIFHALAFPCIVIGFLAVLDFHNKKGINNFYSLHSWIGFVAMGLFGLQYAVGFFSFLLLLICNKGTAGFRASLVPVHAAFGILTFVLGVCACLTGLTEKALFTLGNSTIGEFQTENRVDRYSGLPDEGVIINAIGVTIIAILAVTMYILSRDKFRVKPRDMRVSVNL